MTDFKAKLPDTDCHDFFVDAMDILHAVELYREARRNLAFGREGQKVFVDMMGELEVDEAQGAADFLKLVGFPLTPALAVTWAKRLRAVEKLEPPFISGPFRSVTPDFPKHFVPPSGGETAAVMTILKGTQPTGKIITVAAGAVVKTDGKPPREPCHTVHSVGVSTLEDVAEWGKLSVAQDAYLTRAHVLNEYAPSARAVRRAKSANLEDYGSLDHPAFGPVTYSKLIVLDLDGLTAPDGMDVGDLEEILPFAMQYCPEQLHDARLMLCPSAGHGKLPKAEASKSGCVSSLSPTDPFPVRN